MSDADVLTMRLLASPCIRDERLPLQAFFNAPNAAYAFNRALVTASPGSWLVWVHQDVYLPEGWSERFRHALQEAQRVMPLVSVVGVYGLNGRGKQARRAGHVLDRGTLLLETVPLPCRADSLDELLFAVRVDAGLTLDASLGFDFYATDLVMEARAKGLDAAVVDAYCEHWSNTPAGPVIPRRMAERIVRSGVAFEKKWGAQLPVQTSWLTVEQAGDVARFVAGFGLEE